MVNSFVVAGLGFGDEGKGGIIDFLCREHKGALVVRYNGGAQAGHNVVDSEGRHHTFAQFGSGTLSGSGTHLSRYMLVNPVFMLYEAAHLAKLECEPFQDCTVEEDALITTPFHVAANRLRELYREKTSGRHGSCGMGIGETVQDSLLHPERALRARDLVQPGLQEKLRLVQETKARELLELIGSDTVSLDGMAQQELEILESPGVLTTCLTLYERWANRVTLVDQNYLQEQLAADRTVIFEGAQGVLLDEDYGFHPHTTWSKTTFQNAKALLQGHPATFMGVLRTYATRHGAGPFPTENSSLKIPDPYNTYGDWQQGFRVGYFDLVLARYAQALVQCDQLVMTYVDVPCTRFCMAYRSPHGLKSALLPVPLNLEDNERRTLWLQTQQPVYENVFSQDRWFQRLEVELGVPITLTSEGPTAQHKTWRK